MEDYTVIYKLEKCYNIRAWNEDGMPIIGELDIWESTDSTYMCKLLGHKSLIFKGTHGTAFLFSFFFERELPTIFEIIKHIYTNRSVNKYFCPFEEQKQWCW